MSLIGRRLLLAGLPAGLFVAGCERSPPAVGTVSAEVAFELRSGRIVLPVVLQGAPILARLDTGAARSVISEEAALRLGLTLGASRWVQGSGGGRVERREAGNVVLQIGHARLNGLPVLAGPEGPGPVQSAAPLLLGADVLAQFFLELEFGTQRLRLWRGHAPVEWPVERRVSLRSRNGGWEMPLQIEDAPAIWALLDLGSYQPLEVSAVVARTLRLLEDRPTSMTAISAADGIHTRPVSRIRNITLADHRIPNVPFSVFGHNRHAAIIGLGLCRRFDLRLDLGSGLAWIRPNAELSEPFEVDTLGLFVGVDDTVVFVAPGSPAESAGFQAGERIADSRPLNREESLGEADEIEFKMQSGERRRVGTAQYY